MEYRAATWRTRRLAAEPCPLWSIGPFAINVLPLKAQVKDRVTRSPTPHYPLKFEITFCVRGVISPLLSNLYLNEVDRMLEKAVQATRRGKSTNVQYARFADDLVILIDAERRSDWLVKAIDRRLREEFAKLRVEINEDKSRMVDLKKGESFTFLGFEYRRVLSLQRKWRPYYAPKLKKRIALFERLREIFRQHVSWPVENVIAKINPILRGWVNYFRVGHSSSCFTMVKRWVEMKVWKHLVRARGRKGFGWKRRSSEWLYDRLGLFNDYQLRRWAGTKVAPAQ